MTDGEALASVTSACARFDVRPPELTPGVVRRIRSALAIVAARWRGLGPSEALSLSFDSRHPAAGLAELEDGAETRVGPTEGAT